MHISLGTANLGQKYGVSNQEVLTEIEATELIRTAFTKGIKHFDTAPDYANSEYLLHNSGVASQSNIQIKVPKSTGANFSQIKHAVDTSLKNLGIEKADRILFHDPEIYKSSNFQIIVEKLVESGATKSVGVSCYTAKEAIDAYGKCKLIDSFQVPENILDRRLIGSYEMEYLAGEGCDIQVRSIFLQGLVFLNKDKLPTSLRSCESQLTALSIFAERNGISILQLCLTYAMKIKWADSVVIGANSITQLLEILETQNHISDFDWNQFEAIPEPLIDPRNW